MSEGNTNKVPAVIGLDLGKKSVQVTVLSADATVLARFKVASKRKAIHDAFEKVDTCRVVMEVGGTSPWVSRLLSDLGFDVMVVAASTLKDIFGTRQKNDKNDADSLAAIALKCPELLRRVTHRNEDQQRHKAQLVLRDGMVRSRTLLVNEVRGVLGSLGAELPACSTDAFCRRVSKILEPRDQELVKGTMELIAALTHNIKALEREIETITETHYKEAAVLRQVGGVGPLTSFAFVLTIGDPRRFKRNRQVGSYLGLVPRQQQSGDDDPQLNITKAGDTLMRRLLVQSAQYTLGPFGKDSDLRRFGLAIAARGGLRAKKRAVIAVARRLAVLLLSLLKTGEVYEPLRHAEHTKEAVTA
jgi:transposase